MRKISWDNAEHWAHYAEGRRGTYRGVALVLFSSRNDCRLEWNGRTLRAETIRRNRASERRCVSYLLHTFKAQVDAILERESEARG